MTTKVFPSKREGICPVCKKPYPIGTRIAKDEKTGLYAMADCIWPSKVKVAMPEGKGSSASLNSPSSINTEQIVDDRLKLAIKIVAKEIPDARNYSDYNTIISEVLANLRSEAWIAHEKWKLKKGIE